jgi:hypothetical protein
MRCYSLSRVRERVGVRGCKRREAVALSQRRPSPGSRSAIARHPLPQAGEGNALQHRSSNSLLNPKLLLLNAKVLL